MRGPNGASPETVSLTTLFILIPNWTQGKTES